MGKVLIAGGGIGGLSTALAFAREDTEFELYERSSEFLEFGAGIQLSPNVVKILYGWGLQEALDEVASFPDRLQFRSAMSGSELGVLRLGNEMLQRYGAPYITVARTDIHQLLLSAVQQHSGYKLNLNCEVVAFEPSEMGVKIRLNPDGIDDGILLVGADGAWSNMRQQLLADGVPQPTGHLAYRALVPQARLPMHLRSTQITVWMGSKMHVVQYPVHRAEFLNVVAIVQGHLHGDLSYWDHTGNTLEIQQRLSATCKPLHDLIRAVPHWRLWALNIRPPMKHANEQAKGRVALVGDAAHPMLPYLAQGAGMAIEDAAVLVSVLKQGRALASTPSHTHDVSDLLHQYAEQRFRRNAQVQARAIRNGKIYHATGMTRFGRDLTLRVLGETLLDQPWLYGYSATP
jgi:salicylate hydroxylase